jgi:hypothetical protein
VLLLRLLRWLLRLLLLLQRRRLRLLRALWALRLLLLRACGAGRRRGRPGELEARGAEVLGRESCALA